MAGTGTPVITKRGNSDNHGPCACPVSRHAEVPQITPIRAASKFVVSDSGNAADDFGFVDRRDVGGPVTIGIGDLIVGAAEHAEQLPQSYPGADLLACLADRRQIG